MDIKPALVKELRERTGAGMMECKKALVETNGDIDLAAEWLRKAGAAKADKKASRVAAEGRVAILSDEKTGRHVVLEVNSETDFVAKDDNFRAFVERVAGVILDAAPGERRGVVAQLASTAGRSRSCGSSSSRRSARTSPCAVSTSSRAARPWARTCTARVSACSSRSRVAAPSSRATSRCRSRRWRRATSSNDDVPKDAARQGARDHRGADGRGEEAARDHRQDGRRPLRKFVDEITLTGQVFVKDDKKRVRDLLRPAQGEGQGFPALRGRRGHREKEHDFVKEVMAQASQSR